MSNINDYVDSFVGHEGGTVADVMRAIPGDAQKARHAMHLQSLYGVPAESIYPNTDDFEQEADQQTFGDMVRSSQPLWSYANSHPMAPHVSSDDWDNLYRASMKVQQLHESSDHLSTPYKAIAAMGHGLKNFLGSTLEGAGIISPETQKAWDEGAFGGLTPEQRDEMKEYFSSTTGAIMQGVGSVGPILGAGAAATFLGIPSALATAGIAGVFALSGGSEAAQSAREAGATPEQQTQARVGGAAVGFGLGVLRIKALEKVIQASSPGMTGWTVAKLQQAGIHGLGFTGLGEVQHAFDVLIARGTYDPNASYGDEHQFAQRLVSNFVLGGIMGVALGKVKPYIDANKPPPHGIDENLDKSIEGVSVEATQKFEEAVQEIMRAKTSERPEMIKRFLEQFQDKEIRIEAAAIDALYKDKIPEPGDGLFGDVPNINAQLELARDQKGKVAFDLKDWIDIVQKNPGIEKAVKDYISVVHGGLTRAEVEEAKEARKVAEEPSPTPEEEYRDAQALPPMQGSEMAEGIRSARASAGINDPKLGIGTLLPGKIGDAQVHWVYMDGQPIGKIHLIAQPDGWVKLSHVFSHGDSAWTVGMDGAKQMMDQIKRWYPISNGVITPDGNTKFDFNRPAPPTVVKTFMEQTADRLQGGTWVVHPYEDYKAYMVPKEKWLAHEVQMADAIESEMKRIAPQLSRVDITHGIARRKNISFGIYVNHAVDGPRMVVALGMEDSPFIYSHPVSVAWHEAIHYLRMRNFFSEGEWDALVRAAREFDWIGHYNIKARYKDVAYSVQLEEAIAHRFSDFYYEWRTRQLDEAQRQQILASGKIADRLMLRMRDLVEGVKKEMEKVFSGKPRWQDLFELTAEGKIGQRDIKAHPAYWHEMQLDLERAKADPMFREKPKDEGRPEWWTFRKERLTPEAFDKLEADLEHAKRVLGKPPEEPRQAVAEERPPVEVPQIDPDTFTNPKYQGLTKLQVKRLIDKQNKLNQENADAVIGHAEKLVKREAKDQWKFWKEEVTKEATRDIQNRPDVAVDRFFGKGEFGGVKMKRLPKFQEDMLTPEQRALIPPEYIAKEGFHPDEVAQMFGYSAGDRMIDDLSNIVKARTSANLQPAQFMRALINQRVEQTMKDRYGTLEEHILDLATDRVTSNLQLGVINEETMAIAEANKLQLPVDLKIVAAGAKEKFGDTPVRLVKSDAHFQNALKAGNEAALVTKKGVTPSPAQAIDALTRQGTSIILAKEAKTIEKLKLKFERFRNQFDKGVVDSTNQEHTNWIRWFMKASGVQLKDEMETIQREVAHSDYPTLDKFVDHRNKDGHSDIYMPYYMLDGEPPVTLDKMTVRQYRSFVHFLESLKAEGVEEQKQKTLGEEFAANARRTRIIDNIEQVGPPKRQEIRGMPKSMLRVFVDAVKQYGAAGLTIESFFNRIDRGNIHGDLSKLARGMASAVNSRDAEIRSMGKKWIDITRHWTHDYMNKLVENDLFKDPRNGTPLPMAMRNVIAVAMNMSANKVKFLKGYGVTEENVMEWLDRHMSKEDWDSLQRINDEIWVPLFNRADQLSRTHKGVGLERVDVPPVQTKYGVYDGWFHPLKYDRKLLDPRAKAYKGDIEALFPEGQEGQGYYRATTPHSYAYARTGFVGPVQLDFDIVPLRIREMIHDINVRPALIDAADVIYNKEFRQAYRERMGEFADAQLEPWLHAVANSVRHDYQMSHSALKWVEFMRKNLINTLIGFNPNTVMKHGPTAFVNSLTEAGIDKQKFLKYTGMMLNPVTRKQLWDLAVNKSEEVSRRWESLGDIRAQIGQEGLFHDVKWRDYFMAMGSKMVSYSDMFSTIPAWHAAYDKAMETLPQRREYAGMTIDEVEKVAIGIADKAVRSAHGSTSIANKPAIMRGSPFWQVYTSLFNFFSHMQQKHYQLAWQAKETYKNVKEWRDGNKTFADAMEFAPQLSWGMFSYVLWPAIIEEMITPQTDEDDESWGYKAWKTMAIGTSSSYVGLRDIVRAMFTNRSYDPQVGLVGTELKAYYDLLHDGSKVMKEGDMSDEQAGELIKHAAIAFGNITGFTTAQEGKWAEYMYRYFAGLEDPNATWSDIMAMNAGKTAKKGRYKTPVEQGLELMGIKE